MAFIGGIEEDLPALLLHDGRIDLRRIIDDTDVLPEIGHAVGIVRIVEEILHAVGQLIQVIDDGLVDGLEHVFLDQALDHIIAGDQDIIGDTGHQLGIQFLIGGEVRIGDVDVVFLLKIIDDLFVDIFAPVVDIELVTAELGDRVVALAEPQKRERGQAQAEQDREHFFHGQISSLLAFLLSRGSRFTRMRISVTTITIRVERAFTLGL